jgi:exodeoxyribonuclease VII large subunit
MTVSDPNALAVLTPSSLNALARELLEQALGQVSVEGEISNLSRPASGHLYFTLKDAGAQVRCALFRTRMAGLACRPADGMAVRVRGRVSLYEPRGDYQLIVDTLAPAGEGALRAEYERLKRKLAAEGLFDNARKRALPPVPRRVAVLTSPRGAALHDVLAALRRRWPLIAVDVLPVPVQGAAAAGTILATLTAVDATAAYDVLMLTRGGGSLEDLACFNDEALARAIAACRTPTLVAIGHEVDFTLAEYAADVRAATPTAAAEYLVPDRHAVLRDLARQAARLRTAAERTLERRAQRVDRLGISLRVHDPERRLALNGERLAGLRQRLHHATTASITRHRRRLESLAPRIAARHPAQRTALAAQRLRQLGESLAHAGPRSLDRPRQRVAVLARALSTVSPRATLARGYVIVRDEHDRPLLSARALARGMPVRLDLHDGSASARIESVTRDDEASPGSA